MIKPGSRIGILGGGQLGRMLALAGARLGLNIVIYDSDLDSPAGQVSREQICAETSNEDALAQFAKSVDLVTYEFENVPQETARLAGKYAPVRPGPLALEVSQDRLIEKSFIGEQGIATVDFHQVDSVQDLAAGIDALGIPSILKTRRFGYDGKGQVVIRSAEQLDDALEQIGHQPAILEAFAPFKRELSIIAARSTTGECAAFPLGENRHEGGILRETLAPANVDKATQARATEIAQTMLEALDYVGVIAIEFFELENGALLVNEFAPRVHNSGHWTQDGCRVDQFELHMRAICGWPLGDTRALAPVRMVNLIGSDTGNWQDWLKTPGALLHLYGKTEARDGRKMGHANIVGTPET